MDPTHREPEEFGRDDDGPGDGPDRGRSPGPRPRSAKGAPKGPDFGRQTPQQARFVRLISGEYLLTVNPVDGSEVELCPPGEQPAAPVRRTAAGRADHERALAPPVPPGPPAPQLPLLERAEERERLVRLLSRGRSVRLTGPAGSGRTALLDAVAADCAALAPDGVVRLSGYRRTVTDLLYGLFDAVNEAPLYRPDRAALLEEVRRIGAVVLLDDLEFGGAALEELLDATPECAFLFATAPDAAAAGADPYLEEVLLAGLGRDASIELLEQVVERPLTEEERNWAGDLWFESEGLPLRFVQAGALLRRRDLPGAAPGAHDAHGPGDRPAGPPFGQDGAGDRVPLPGPGEAAAPAALLAAGLSEPARDTLRFAVALGGEVPHQAHLPALVGDTHADAALGELAGCGLLSPAGPRYRLAAGVVAQLEAAGYGEDATDRARTAAQHYAWWAGHPSVTPERAAAEADAVLAAMAQLVPGDGAGQTSAAVLLARSAAPAFAAGLHWGAWERALRIGQEAARIAGEVAEEAYFHHELGILALLSGNPDRARTELETSIGMRGALADKPGAVAGRRALALVADRSGGPLPGVLTQVGEDVPFAEPVEQAPSARPMTATTQPLSTARPDEGPATVMTARRSAPATVATPAARGGRLSVLGFARRNLVATAAGVLLAGVLGTVVVLGMTSGGDDVPGNRGVTSEQSPGEQDDGTEEDPAGDPADDSTPGSTTSGGGVTPGPSGSEITPSGSGSPSTGPTGPSDTPSSDRPTSDKPSSDRPTQSSSPTDSSSPTTPESPSPSDTETESPEPTETPTEPEPGSPDTSDSASGPSSSSSAAAAGPDGGPVAA
ncbi:ATP-binding protein [Streptomyces sp. ML-6]|uniref:tetratricopeptide repeat protein n=1 Tax=Streptomyces sp. ML-6 TaxID=2982693 RepID=UPI0024C0DE9E|nr:ATP-binding protein [Streptomyces sp. ML-6]MDK0522265.1 ATP-binding protein [Streptomyces sp. ML-6]